MSACILSLVLNRVFLEMFVCLSGKGVGGTIKFAYTWVLVTTRHVRTNYFLYFLHLITLALVKGVKETQVVVVGVIVFLSTQDL